MERLGKPSALWRAMVCGGRLAIRAVGPAVKILSHDNYTFYNPRLHPEFTPEGSPRFSSKAPTRNHSPTTWASAKPRYDYNQILYRLDLDDPALAASNARTDLDLVGRQCDLEAAVNHASGRCSLMKCPIVPSMIVKFIPPVELRKKSHFRGRKEIDIRRGLSRIER